jgi:hypothetical protein
MLLLIATKIKINSFDFQKSKKNVVCCYLDVRGSEVPKLALIKNKKVGISRKNEIPTIIVQFENLTETPSLLSPHSA